MTCNKNPLAYFYNWDKNFITYEHYPFPSSCECIGDFRLVYISAVFAKDSRGIAQCVCYESVLPNFMISLCQLCFSKNGFLNLNISVQLEKHALLILKKQLFTRSYPPVDLYLNFEKSSWKTQVRRTGFLACKNEFRN